MGKAANSSISLKQIHVTDNFWNKYVHLVKDVIIPYQWDILNDKLEDVETSHCIENFKIAAGEKEGEFQGAVFQDTDVAKWLEAVGFVLNYERDEKLEELADETIELIGRAQQPENVDSWKLYQNLQILSARLSDRKREKSMDIRDIRK